MAIVCSICGKKLSGGSDFPLSENNAQDRICLDCEQRKQNCIASLAQRPENYPLCRTSFLAYSEQVSPKIRRELDSMLEVWDHQYQAKRETHQQAVDAPAAQQTTWDTAYRNMMVNTGFHFEGFRIVKYLNVISAETVLGAGLGTRFSAWAANLAGVQTESFAKKFEQAKTAAMNQLVTKAVNLGANALIGVSFDYPLIYNKVIAVIANATAVVVEKEGLE